MLLDIVKYGDPVLREKAHAVPMVTAELKSLAYDMIDTMHNARGVGLAAEQIGRTESMCVIDIPSGCEDDPDVEAFNASVAQPLIMFNPQIISLEGEQSGKEGCLSFPNMSGNVVRAERVTCQYMNDSGMPCVVTARGFLARAIQHETDHLNGVLYVDRYSDEDKQKTAKRLQKMAKKNGGIL